MHRLPRTRERDRHRLEAALDPATAWMEEKRAPALAPVVASSVPRLTAVGGEFRLSSAVAMKEVCSSFRFQALGHLE